MFGAQERPKREDLDNFKLPKKQNSFVEKIEAIILDYESSKNLSEYAKGRLSAYKNCLEIFKNK